MIVNDGNVDNRSPFAWQMKAAIEVVLDMLTRRWSGEPHDLPTMWQFLFKTPLPASLWSAKLGDDYWELYPEGRFVRYRPSADDLTRTEVAVFSWNADDNREAPPVAAVKLMVLLEAARRVMPPVDLDSFLGSALNNLMNRAAR